jgi:transposase-like protein
MSGHGSVPFFCPYCGDEELVPYGETHGEWRCESCRRAFALRTVKQAPAAVQQTPERAEVAR